MAGDIRMTPVTYVAPCSRRRHAKNLTVISAIVKLRGASDLDTFNAAMEKVPRFEELYALPSSAATCVRATKFVRALECDLEWWSQKGHPELLNEWRARNPNSLPSTTTTTAATPLALAEEDDEEQTEDSMESDASPDEIRTAIEKLKSEERLEDTNYKRAIDALHASIAASKTGYEQRVEKMTSKRKNLEVTLDRAEKTETIRKKIKDANDRSRQLQEEQRACELQLANLNNELLALKK